ncbi:MAG: hypothetical protein ACYC2O_02220, partial [Microthrixaceae bacterium]
MRGLTNYLTILCVAAGGVGVMAAAWRPGGRPVRPWRVVLGLGTAVAVVLTGTALWPGTLSAFGLLHAVYLGIVVTLPIIGVGIALVARRRAGPAVLVMCGLLVLPAPLGWYMTHVEPHWLRVDHLAVPLPADRAGSGTIRVAVLSDLQTTGVGDHERAAVQAVLDAEPDVVLLPGDLFQVDGDRRAAGLEGLRSLLSTLDAPHGVWIVEGDVDGELVASDVLEGTGIEVLDDRVVELDVRGRPLLLGGVALDVTTPAAAAVRERLLAEPDDGAVTVALSHRPDAVLHLPAGSRVDL